MLNKIKNRMFAAKAEARQHRTERFDTRVYEHPMGAEKGVAPQANAAPGNIPGTPKIRIEGISKRFGKVQANRDITLDIHAGRVLALLGENGAGKSTLMSILSGRYQPDSGTIYVDGRPMKISSSRDAFEAGIGMVYQHFMLVNTMTVAQNVLLGQEDGFWVSPAQQEARVRALAEQYGLEIDPAAKIHELSMGERQRVEILKLLHRNSEVLIFDEPTAVLTPPEIVKLFEAIRTMAAKGKAIVFISHKMEEVLSLSDDIAVLRRGEIVDRMKPAEIKSKAELASRMVGREVLLEVDRAPVKIGEVVMELKGLAGNGLHDINFSLHKGEILAIVGVAGNGQKELVEVVTGLAQPRYGDIRLLGRSWKEFYETYVWKDSICYVPEDRLGLATCPQLNMVDNVLLTTRQGFTKGPFLTRKRALRVTGELIRDYNVRPPRVTTLAGKLSGGNLQKLVLAREFYRTPKILVVEQPTQGLDISATEEVWRELLAARQEAGVLLVTGDLSEALQLADRIAVMFSGRIMDIIPTIDTERIDQIGLLMAGVEQ